jgi:hypothetical protein
MRRIEELQAHEFPGVDPAQFEEWRDAAVRAQKNTKTFLIAFLILDVLLLLFAGVVSLGGIPALLILIAINRRPSRLLRELGVSPWDIRRARKSSAPPAPAEPMKKCPRCAEWIKAEAAACRFCGQAFTSEEVAREVDLQVKQKETLRADREARAARNKIDARLSVLRTVYYIAAGLCGLGALISLAGLTAETAPRGKLGIVVFLVLTLAMAALWIAAAWGLGKRRPWGRTLAIVISVLSLAGIPIGTALGIYGLIVLNSPEAKDVFFRANAPAGAQEAGPAS